MKPFNFLENFKTSLSSRQYLTGGYLNLALMMVIGGAVLWSVVTRREIPGFYFDLAQFFLSILGVLTNVFVIIYKEAPLRRTVVRGWGAQLLGVVGILFWTCVGYLGLQTILGRFIG